MSLSNPVGSPPLNSCNSCGCTPGGCACGANLATATPVESFVGLVTKHGAFRATYSAILQTAAGAIVHTNFGLGANWLLADLAYFVSQNGNLGFILSTDCQYWFTPTTGLTTTYVPMFGSLAKLSYTSGIYTLSLPDGTEYKFYESLGLLYSVKTPGGQETINDLNGSGQLLSTKRSFPNSGTPTTTEIRRYEYSGNRIKYVTLERTGSPASPLRRMAFTYYGPNDPSGDEGLLRTREEQVWQDGAWKSLGRTLIRYYKHGDTHGSTAQIKYVLSPEGYARLSEFIDPLVASDEQVAPYAVKAYEYNPTSHRLTEVRRKGGTLVYRLTYEENNNCGYAVGYNVWKTKVTVQHPNGYLRVVYSNHIQDVILNVYKHPTAPAIYWANFTQYIDDSASGLEANDGKPWRMVKPSGITSYAETGTTPFLQVNLVGAGINLSAFSVNVYGDGTTGKPAGYVVEEHLTDGDATPDANSLIRSRTYTDHTLTAPLGTLVVPHTVAEYPTAAGAAVTTSFAFTVNTSGAILGQTTTLPAVPLAQNGSDNADTIIETFDSQSRLTEVVDPRGVQTENVYDDVTGAMLKTTADVGFDNLNLATDFRVDDLGRTILSLAPLRSAENGYQGQPVREATFVVYRDAEHEVWTASGYTTGPNHGPEYAFTLTNPVSILRTDKDGRTVDQISAFRAETVGPLTAGDSFPQSSWVRWTRTIYNDAGYLVATRTYHNIPAEGDGLPGVNYDETHTAYDIMGRANRNVAEDQTITRTVFDPRGLPLSIFVGINDTGATEENPAGATPPSPTVADPNNMRAVRINQYDGGAIGGKNGHLTRVTRPVNDNSTEDRLTEIQYDYRDRRIATTFFLLTTIQFKSTLQHDNIDRVTIREKFIIVNSGTPKRIAHRELLHDERNHIFRTIVWAVDAGGGLGNALFSDRWFDQSGNLICDKPAGSDAFTKTQLDALGRPVATFVGYYNLPYETSPPPLIPYASIYNTTTNEVVISNDIIVEQSVIQFDEANNTTRTTVKRRRDDANPATTGALGSDTVEPKARTTYSDVWSDGSGRTIATANYGTTKFPEARSSTIPGSSDLLLVSLTRFNDRGEAFESVDPSGKVTRVDSDDMGREIRTIDNYCRECTPHAPHEVSPSPSPTAGPFNITVEKTYFVRDLVATLTAVNAVTGNQVTRYEYGTTLETSLVARNDLLVEEIFPDGADATDRMKYTYNRQLEVTTSTDQNGTNHIFYRDNLGRLANDAVLNFGGTTFDNFRIYDDRGQLFLLRSMQGGTIWISDLAYQYNDFMQLAEEYQQHGGPSNFSSSPKVAYTYAPGSIDAGRTNNTVRRTGVTYPTARITPPTLAYDYGTAGEIDDKLSRVEKLDFAGASEAVEYAYLGLAGIVQATYNDPSVRYSLISGASAMRYVGLDQFDRIVDCLWETTGGTPTTLAQLKYGYDRAGNRTFRRDQTARDAGKKFDELYTHDGLHRLKAAGRGELVSDNSRLDSTTFAQAWELDQTGNWSGFTQFDNQGASFASMDQKRKSNAANEITAIDSVSGPTWKQPGYDRAGNMTTIPQPKSPPDGFKGEYDAWNRLARLRDALTNALVEEYQYDGFHRRIVTKKYAAGVLSETRHYYYSDSWQVVEERVGDDPFTAVVDRQFLWGMRYIDDLVLRDDIVGGTLDERLYAMQDANWNVVAICDDAGDVQERYAYTPYGAPLFLDDDFAIKSPNASDFAWETLFCGYRYDAATGLYHVRHRYLHPVLGCWVTRDPIGYTGGDVNLLRYVLSMPSFGIDPSGLELPWILPQPWFMGGFRVDDDKVASQRDARRLIQLSEHIKNDCLLDSRSILRNRLCVERSTYATYCLYGHYGVESLFNKLEGALGEISGISIDASDKSKLGGYRNDNTLVFQSPMHQVDVVTLMHELVHRIHHRDIGWESASTMEGVAFAFESDYRFLMMVQKQLLCKIEVGGNEDDGTIGTVGEAMQKLEMHINNRKDIMRSQAAASSAFEQGRTHLPDSAHYDGKSRKLNANDYRNMQRVTGLKPIIFDELRTLVEKYARDRLK